MKELDVTKNGRTKGKLIHDIMNDNCHFNPRYRDEYEPYIFVSEDALRVLSIEDGMTDHSENIKFANTILGIKIFLNYHLEELDFKIGWFLKVENEPMRFVDKRALEMLTIKKFCIMCNKSLPEKQVSELCTGCKLLNPRTEVELGKKRRDKFFNKIKDRIDP